VAAQARAQREGPVGARHDDQQQGDQPEGEYGIGGHEVASLLVAGRCRNDIGEPAKGASNFAHSGR
jgi:hypothetical protein